MKTIEPDNTDPSLQMLLKEWQPQQTLPPRFQEMVWRRIERAEISPAPTISLATTLAKWLASMVPRPAFATAYVTMLLAVGIGLGWNRAQQYSAQITGDLSARYVQIVDPYQPKP